MDACRCYGVPDGGICSWCDFLYNGKKMVVEGGCRGGERMAEKYSKAIYKTNEKGISSLRMDRVISTKAIRLYDLYKSRLAIFSDGSVLVMDSVLGDRWIVISIHRTMGQLVFIDFNGKMYLDRSHFVTKQDHVRVRIMEQDVHHLNHLREYPEKLMEYKGLLLGYNPYEVHGPYLVVGKTMTFTCYSFAQAVLYWNWESRDAGILDGGQLRNACHLNDDE